MPVPTRIAAHFAPSPLASQWMVSPGGDALVVGALVGLSPILRWLCTWHPSILPPFAPFEFSWTEFLALWLGGWWYWRGLALTPAEQRPSMARSLSFVAGMAVIYAVVQTRFEYLALHMFFLDRLQHVGMHHLGPLLIALAWPGPVMERGLPAVLRRLASWRAIRFSIAVLQQPLLAAFLFVGLIAFWLIPSVHFRAMLDPRLYVLMNWSMVVDGILFWCLVLDPRPQPPARASFLMRGALSALVMFPQILLGAGITFASRDLYPFYDLCGRAYPAIGAGTDQILGGLIIWIPAAMMSVVGALAVANAWRRCEGLRFDREDASSAMAVRSSDWTGLGGCPAEPD